MANKETIAIFAGNGDLPRKLIQHFQYHQIKHVVIAFEGITDPSGFTESIFHYVGQVGAILSTLRAHQVTHIVMAGSMRRPNLRKLSLDWEGTKWLARLGTSVFLGDDALLSRLVNLMGEEGFTVIGPHTILSELTVEPGVLSLCVPGNHSLHDIQRGKEILIGMSSFDVGQATVVQQGIVLGIEAVEGTRALLHRVAHLKLGSTPNDLGKETSHTKSSGGVLIKLPKRGQSVCVDLPTIGPHTIEEAHNAGLEGIAISAHTTQILDKEKVIQLCNTYGMFLVAIDVKE